MRRAQLLRLVLRSSCASRMAGAPSSVPRASFFPWMRCCSNRNTGPSVLRDPVCGKRERPAIPEHRKPSFPCHPSTGTQLLRYRNSRSSDLERKTPGLCNGLSSLSQCHRWGQSAATVDMEPGMTPGREHGDQFLGDLPLFQEQSEHLMNKKRLQLRGSRSGETLNVPLRENQPSATSTWAVRIEPQEVAEGLDRDDRPRTGIILGCRHSQKSLERLPRHSDSNRRGGPGRTENTA